MEAFPLYGMLLPDEKLQKLKTMVPATMVPYTGLPLLEGRAGREIPEKEGHILKEGRS